MPKIKSSLDPETQPFSIRLSKDTLRIIREEAARERRSINAQINTILSQWLQTVRKTPRTP